MDYLQVEDGVIVNVIVCDDLNIVEELGLKPFYQNAQIGAPYEPPFENQDPATQIQTLKAENTLLKAQLQVQTERSDFIEDCIAEMAMQVYAE